jgi:hypothetical protein
MPAAWYWRRDARCVWRIDIWAQARRAVLEEEAMEKAKAALSRYGEQVLWVLLISWESLAFSCILHENVEYPGGQLWDLLVHLQEVCPFSGWVYRIPVSTKAVGSYIAVFHHVYACIEDARSHCRPIALKHHT